jgi:hypothetical protein
MIRFVDLTPYYWASDDPEDCSPMCAFIDTVTDQFLDNELGCHNFSSEEEVAFLGERAHALVPKDFFINRKKAQVASACKTLRRAGFAPSSDVAIRLGLPNDDVTPQ